MSFTDFLNWIVCFFAKTKKLPKFFVYDFPGGSDGKVSAYNAGDLGSIPGSGRSPGEGNGLPTPVFFPGRFHGQRSLAGYSPSVHKELDKTEATFTGILQEKGIT